ncbi:MAG: DNA-directed RNA polymerase subunit omega [Nitrospinae bacterium RIFCSPLOWO2_12_FULL_47_7]|nr:MAG: DNA-directed RNA polymerase subunit omega [Nitrospinae bacterium RIFCSPLOWO2_12_FULL_47_7]
MQVILDLEKKALDVVKSRYLLSILVAQRIHQLEKGAKPCIDLPEDQFTIKKYYEVALKEIIEGSMDLEQMNA